MTNWTLDRKARIPYSYERFAQTKSFVFRKWCDQAKERGLISSVDLSGSCKYGSQFMNHVFGGKIFAHYNEHQYNIIGGRIVDLSHDAIDVCRISNPYLHEPEYFAIPEKKPLSINAYRALKAGLASFWRKLVLLMFDFSNLATGLVQQFQSSAKSIS
jgi:hypothetical protein